MFNDNKSKVFHVADPENRFMPNMHAVRGVGKRAGLETIVMYAKELFDDGKEAVVNRLDISERFEQALPDWDSENVDDVPGMIYLGDWSFNDLKEMNGVLQDGSAVITFVTPNPYTAAAYGVLSKTGIALEVIDSAIDMINKFSNLKIDKDKTYPIYRPNNNFDKARNLVVSLSQVQKSDVYDIKELWPLQPGNWWEYSFIGEKYAKMKVKEIMKINEMSLIPWVLEFYIDGELDEVEEHYLGYKRDSLYEYGYGYNAWGLYDNPIKYGDDKMKVGNEYITLINGINWTYENRHGEMIEEYQERDIKKIITLERKEDLIVNNIPYGDCLRTKWEEGYQKLYLFYSKNVGIIRITNPEEGNLDLTN